MLLVQDMVLLLDMFVPVYSDMSEPVGGAGDVIDGTRLGVGVNVVGICDALPTNE